MHKNVALVGLGPHSRRIYIHYLNKIGVTPRLIIELESKRDFVLKFLKERNINSKTFFIPNEFCNFEKIPLEIQNKLSNSLNENNISHAIISTEPKAHKAYLTFFMKQGLKILTDKPITSPLYVADNLSSAQEVQNDYDLLCNLYKETKEDGVRVEVQCQRRYHPAYNFIRNQLNKIVSEYKIPITYIDSYHCDGMWTMPDEFESRENHPYKYGYGKLFHSGYHFVDIVSWFLQINKQLTNKQPDHFSLYAAETRPNDALSIINKEDYQRLFNSKKLDPVFNEYNLRGINATGEIDFHSLIQFKKQQNVITTVHLGLMQSGFSRRGWLDLPEDTYKGNGRIRHERLNIHIGPLMNIQVHSYQSKEVKERKIDDGYDVGALEHFDIFIFRNTDLIGGKAFEKISAKDLISKTNDLGYFIGFNEQARESCLVKFLNNESGESDLLDHDLTIKLMHKSYEALSLKSINHSPLVTSLMV